MQLTDLKDPCMRTKILAFVLSFASSLFFSYSSPAFASPSAGEDWITVSQKTDAANTKKEGTRGRRGREDAVAAKKDTRPDDRKLILERPSLEEARFSPFRKRSSTEVPPCPLW